jgi:hypothetical protein
VRSDQGSVNRHADMSHDLSRTNCKRLTLVGRLTTELGILALLLPVPVSRSPFMMLYLYLYLCFCSTEDRESDKKSVRRSLIVRWYWLYDEVYESRKLTPLATMPLNKSGHGETEHDQAHPVNDVKANTRYNIVFHCDDDVHSKHRDQLGIPGGIICLCG